MNMITLQPLNWVPHRTRDINTLEMVQRCAARFAKHDYRRITSVTKLLGGLDWPVLSDRRREARLSLLSKAAGGHSAISLMQSISAYETNTPR